MSMPLVLLNKLKECLIAKENDEENGSDDDRKERECVCVYAFIK